MAGKEQVMAVLMGPAEVRQTFRDWPADMCLAVCLMERGDCQLVVFRHEEAAEFPARLRRHLRLAAADLCFFPRVDGYPTRALLYSDEQRLMTLVAEAPEIVEEAADYSVNYAYALDEGLDPAVFLGVEPVQTAPEVEPDPAPEAEPEVAGGPAPFVSRRSKPVARPAPEAAGRVRKALLPGFMQRQEAIRPGPYFRSARELGAVDDQPVLCDLMPEQRGWILISRHDEGGADIRVSDPDLIYLRDDRSVVAIRLEPAWQASAALPGRVWIRADSLPASLRKIFADCVGSAELTGTGSFLYFHVRARPVPPLMQAPAETPVSAAAGQGLRAVRPAQEAIAVSEDPSAPEADAQADAAAVSPAAMVPVPVRPRRLWRGRRRWLALTAAASVLVLIQIGLQLGGRGDVSATGRDVPIDWETFRSAWQAAKAG